MYGANKITVKIAVEVMIWILIFLAGLVFFSYQINFIDKGKNIDYGTQIRDMAYTTALDVLEEYADYQSKSRGTIMLRNEDNIEEKVIRRFDQLFRERLEFWRMNNPDGNVELVLDPITSDNIEVNRGPRLEDAVNNSGAYSQYEGVGENPIEGSSAHEIDSENLPYIRTAADKNITITIRETMFKNGQTVQGVQKNSLNYKRGKETKFSFRLDAQMQHRDYINN